MSIIKAKRRLDASQAASSLTDRRTCLQVLASLPFLGALELSREHEPAFACIGLGVAVGDRKKFEKIGFWLVEGASYRLFLARDERGLFALSATCTHAAGAIVAPNAEGLAICPAHGSAYDKLGKVVKGPATRPLPHFAVSDCAGRIRVDVSKEVTVDTRIP